MWNKITKGNEKLSKIAILSLLILGIITGCFNQTVDETQKITTVIIETEKNTVWADGQEIITFSAIIKDQKGNAMEVQGIKYYYQLNGSPKVSILENGFKTNIAGEYTIFAQVADIKSNSEKIIAKEMPKVAEITIIPDTTTINANNMDKVTFSAKIKDQYGSEIGNKIPKYYQTYLGDEVEFESKTNMFATKVAGVYKIKAKIDTIISNEITVNAKSLNTDAVDIGETKQNLTFAYIANKNISENNITGILNLVQQGTNGVIIKWSSTNNNIINPDTGEVTRGEEDKPVIISAHISKGTASDVVQFILTVKISEVAQLKKELEDAKTALTFTTIKNDNTDADNIKNQLNLPKNGINATTIVWNISSIADGASINKNTGEIIRGTKDARATLTATVTKSIYSTTKEFNITIKQSVESLKEEVVSTKNEITFPNIKGSNINVDNIVSDLVLPKIGLFGTIITWNVTGGINGANIDTATGKVTRGLVDTTVTLKATVSKEEITEQVSFTLTIKQSAEAANLKDVLNAKQDLTFESIRNENSDANNIISDLKLPTVGTSGTAILWTVSNGINGTNINTTNGEVTRGSQDTVVKLTAVITKGIASDTKEFSLKIPMSDNAAVNSEKVDLTFDKIALQNIAIDTITGNMVLPKNGINGTSIGWTKSAVSNGADINLDTGVVIRGSIDKQVTITAEIKKGIAIEKVDFTITIKASDDAIDISSAKASLNFDKIKKLNESTYKIKSGLNLPSTFGNVAVSWAIKNNINNTDVDTRTGEVTRGTADTEVVLTAKFSKGIMSDTKEFVITILKSIETELEEAKEAITFDLIKGINTTSSGIFANLSLPATGINETTITWQSVNVKNGANIDNTGVVSRGTTDTAIVLAAIISKEGISVKKEIPLIIKISEEAANVRDVQIDKESLTSGAILLSNKNLQNIVGNINKLPTTGANGTLITWSITGSSNGADINIATGNVIRGTSDTAIKLTAEISKGKVTETKIFELVIKESQLSLDTKAVNAAESNLTFEKIANGNSSTSNIVGAMLLPSITEEGVTILWSKEKIVDNGGEIDLATGEVIKGLKGETTINLTAKLAKGEVKAVKTFTIVIKQLDDAIDVANAKNTLTFDVIKKGNSSMDNIVGDLYLPSVWGGVNVTWSALGVTSGAGIDVVTGKVIWAITESSITLKGILSKGLVLENVIFTLILRGVPDGYIYVEGGNFSNNLVKGINWNYIIGKYEVTQQEFQNIMGYNSSCFITNGLKKPVEQITWFDAIAFCNEKSITEGLTPAYEISNVLKIGNNITYAGVTLKKSNGWRIPNKNEWEYAARGGKYSCGYIYAGSNNFDEVGWGYYNSDKSTHDVGCKKPNELGMYDVTGNVDEMCYERFYYSNTSEFTMYHTGGGEWQDGNYFEKNGMLNGNLSLWSVVPDLSYKLSCVGFRIVRTVK